MSIIVNEEFNTTIIEQFVMNSCLHSVKCCEQKISTILLTCKLILFKNQNEIKIVYVLL